MGGIPDQVIDLLGVRPRRITVLKDVPLANGSWLVEAPGKQPLGLRRYHAGATAEDLAYEHAVLEYLAKGGWVVPAPVSETIHYQGRRYCLTRYVPGAAIAAEDAGQRRRRGRDLARLHLALRGLGERIGQRPGWRPQHTGTTVHTAIDWDDCASYPGPGPRSRSLRAPAGRRVSWFPPSPLAGRLSRRSAAGTEHSRKRWCR
jgi:phosphotransferase family enzyme